MQWGMFWSRNSGSIGHSAVMGLEQVSVFPGGPASSLADCLVEGGVWTDWSVPYTFAVPRPCLLSLLRARSGCSQHTPWNVVALASHPLCPSSPLRGQDIIGPCFCMVCTSPLRA